MELKKSMSQKLRMDGRDYSRSGWYFVTLGADYHRHLFGTVKTCKMHTNALGRLIEQCWSEIPWHYSHITLGAWQIMPNHFHGLLRIVRSGGKGLGEVMNMFKGAVTRKWRSNSTNAATVSSVGSRYSEKEPATIWAPNYYDVICFDAEELEVREKYICANPRRWALRDVPQGMIRKSRYKGNTTLLRQPGRRWALRVSRRASESDITALQNKLASFNDLVCGTFFSPGERACLKTLQAGKGKIIWVLPMAMPETISVSWTDAFVENRALWLSAFTGKATRASCEQANRWVEQFCDAALHHDLAKVQQVTKR